MVAQSWPLAGELDERLSIEAQLVLLARSLFRQGYADQLGGHISYRTGDELIVTPWELAWDEIEPEDLLRIDLAGNLRTGSLSVPGGIPLHLALHEARDDVRVIVHNHSRWGTVWADLRRVPPVYDQTGAFTPGEPAFYDEFEHVGSVDNARRAVAAFATGHVGFLAGHGVMVTASSVSQAYTRAVTLEWRCRQAWVVEAAGNGVALTPDMVELIGGGLEAFDRYVTMLFEAAARRELRADARLAQRCAAHGRRLEPSP